MRSFHSRALMLLDDQVAWLPLVLVAAAACGLAVSTQPLPIAVVIPALAVGATVMPLVSAGVFVGLALILADNALPGLDLTRFSFGEVTGTDLAFLALLAFAVIRRISGVAVARSH